MAQNLQVTNTLQGGGSISDDVTDVSQRVGFGGAILPAVQLSLTYGTGANQVNKQYLKKRTIANGVTDLIDLKALTDFQGAALDFAKIKYIFIGIITPDGTKELRVGPQNATNAFSGFWGGSGATVYDRVWDSKEYKAPVSGVITGPTTANRILAINNPSTATDYAIWVLGTDV